MYKRKDRGTMKLFEELFEFGGKLNENNRWLKIKELISWQWLEDEYAQYASKRGRPCKDAQLVIGLLLLKHMLGVSDREVVAMMLENPYMQAFCGLEHFTTEKEIHPSTLTMVRKRVGARYFRELEEKTYRLLVEKKVLKRKGMLIDGTVFPEKITYPNDIGLLEKAREQTVKIIKEVSGAIGKRWRTYCRVARKVYLSFAKQKIKTKKTIRKAMKKMLQYVKRNISQCKAAIREAKARGQQIRDDMLRKIGIIEKLWEQQMRMYREKIHRIEERIVSIHRPYVRPIKRGKNGKDVEFGPKGAVRLVDGYLFLDWFSHTNFSEAHPEIVKKQIQGYEKLFGKKPPSIGGDQLYGNRENRQLLESEGIRGVLVPLGRKKKKPDRWVKKKQRERNRIEAAIGNGKEHYGLGAIRYWIKDGAELWVRCGLLAMNLNTAMKRI